MGVLVAMDLPDAPVEPGGESAAGVRIRNAGSVVDQFDMDVVGEAASWARVEPTSVNLLPGEEGSARLLFTPPRSSRVVAGPVPFALRVMSREDTAGSMIEEAMVTIGPYQDTAAQLVPRTSTGRRVGRHQLALDNLGNNPELVSVSASDPDILLDLKVDPANVTVEPGTATFVRVRAKPKKRFLRGPNKSLPFEVLVSPETSDPVLLPGAMVQQSILPSWLFKALALLLAIAAALVAFWFLLLKPTVESTAQNVAEDQTEKLAAAIVDASDKAEAAEATAAEAQQESAAAQEESAAAQEESAAAQQSAAKSQQRVQQALGPGGAAAAGRSTTGASPGGTLDSSAAIDFRVTTDVDAAGGFEPSTFEPPRRRTIWVSDLVLQNPRGDTGTLRVMRDDEILLEFGLENFRDLDYHFIQPAMFSRAEPVVVSVDCRNTTGAACTPSVFFSGQQVAPERRPQRQGNGGNGGGGNAGGGNGGGGNN
jgi:hypothetical protein